MEAARVVDRMTPFTESRKLSVVTKQTGVPRDGGGEGVTGVGPVRVQGGAVPPSGLRGLFHRDAHAKADPAVLFK